MATNPYLLGKLQYTYAPAKRALTGEGAAPVWDGNTQSFVTPMEDYRQKYAQRGNFRMAIEDGAALPYGPLEKLNADGSWSPVNDPNIDYDPRQTPDVLDSNERRRFVQGFMEAPDSYDIAKKSLQTVATNNGWKEPSRNDKTTLLSVIGDVAPYVGLMMGGVNALNGLSGLLGVETIGQNTARLMSGLGDVPVDIPSGTSWLGNEGLSSIPEAVRSLPNINPSNVSWLGNEGLPSIEEAVRDFNPASQPGPLDDLIPPTNIPNSPSPPNPSAPPSPPNPSSPYNPGQVMDSAIPPVAPPPGGTRSIIDTITANPGTALQVAGAAAGLLGAATQTQEDTPYNPAPINQSIVNQFGRVPTGQNINYQDFYSLGLPQGLLDSRIRRLGGLIG